MLFSGEHSSPEVVWVFRDISYKLLLYLHLTKVTTVSSLAVNYTMARRFSAEEKGKAPASNPPGPPRLRMRAPEFDTSELIKDNMLTLVGRLTNPKEQKMSLVLPYLAKTWKLIGSSSGSDLGNGCFQFRLNSESDLREVLSNRPYQYIWPLDGHNSTVGVDNLPKLPGTDTLLDISQRHSSPLLA